MREPAELPFYERPDLTPYILHLTKNTKAQDKYSALDNLLNILKEGEIWGSEPGRPGFIKGRYTAACFMDVPFAALKYVLNPRDADPRRPRYEPYGVFVTKKFAYAKGCRPVLYLSDRETADLRIPEGDLWRVVRFEVNGGWISWIHEREWRCKGAFDLPSNPGVIVRTRTEAEELAEEIHKRGSKYRSKPSSIIPAEVVCQGLPKASHRS